MILSGDTTEVAKCPTTGQLRKVFERGDTTEAAKCPTTSQLRKVFERVTVAGGAKIAGKRNYRKPDYCFFCKNMYVSKISNHYMNIHAKEPRVEEIANLPCHSAMRKRLFTLLQNDGNHLHNCMVLQSGCGELTVSRRPGHKDGASAENYLPCVDCKAWVFKKNLSLHSKKCPAGKLKDTNFLRNSQMLLSPFLSYDNEDEEIEDIFLKMKETVKYPGLKTVCQQDSLIKEFCRGLVHKIGTEGEQRRKDKDNIRTKVRAVARLLVGLNERTNQSLSLEEYIKPKTFMLIVNTVKDMGMHSPNLALTLGHYIKQICQLKKSVALQTEGELKRKEADDFDLLYQAHWNNYVSAVSLRRQKLRSLNKTLELPLTSDLVKLKDFLDSKIESFLSKFHHSYQEWIDAAQALMVRLILFNKRRVSEVEELKSADVIDNQNSSDSQDIIDQMDVTERALAKRMKVIEVRGKSTRGLRKVYIILSEQMNKACLHLLSTRMHAGISPTNPYLFARCERSPLDGCQAMRVMSERCPDLENPERVRTRLLRKHLATTVQILDMTGDELKMVADHMGHSVSVHTDVYRLQSSLLEKTKVARALIALENGQMSKFAGRTLASCTIEELPAAEEEENSDNSESRSDSVSKEGSEQSDIEQRKGVKRKSQEQEDNNKFRCGPHPRKRWDENEEKTLFLAFKESIDLKRNPTAVQIKKAQEKYPCLKLRSVAVIRSKINNINLGKCKFQLS
ncbi:hypothetical protein EGW08_012732 [Elysia chlorotica]|uniref:Tyr recombinase domain-containing protein n=1 Tax=Elysia chlorotica TaxID=188477 RepID=A0A3S1HHK7_ELYCH|nr:hypothetical protein EGW08_012732 [Elysia chlorotica]